jgi:acetyl-CoA carboxylase biotin carboxylase subunit
VPGVDAAAEAAGSIGYPVMLKAAAGGGGRGIRVVHDEDALRSAFGQASTEAQKAFGDGTMYLERFVERARHVEVQVLGDGSDAVHLFERECSLQRRRQKVVEEAVSPGITQDVRERMTRAAVDLCREVGYTSAGTVEFLVDDATQEFFFIEMNTRIQVEHPTTELVTGIDLVAEQLRIAAGEPLRFAQEEIEQRGHAIEYRVCAEDPANDFMPQPGSVGRITLPAGPWVRCDTWLEPDGTVPPYYDSLLAKVIVWGADRDEALARSRRALDEFSVAGITTTAGLLRELVDEPWVASADFHTGTLEQWLAERKEGTT